MGLIVFAEAGLDQLDQRFHGLGGLGPLGLDQDRWPWPAASIIRPMIEVPPTVWPSRVTRIWALKSAAQRTNCAEARACRPFLLGITTSAK